MILNQLDKAALTLHEGFLTTGLGGRGAVVVFLLVGAMFPDSFGFLFWLGITFIFDMSMLSPSDLGITAVQFNVMAVILILIGTVGLGWNLQKMANEPAVRKPTVAK